MKNTLKFLLFTLLFSCNDGESNKLIERIDFILRENMTLRSQNEALLNDLKNCNMVIGESKVKEISSDSKPKPDEQIIGKCKTPILYGGGDLTIEKDNGKYFKIERFTDNSTSKDEMTFGMDAYNMVFRTKGRNSTDHWVILKNGKLEVRDRDGLIYTSEPK